MRCDEEGVSLRPSLLLIHLADFLSVLIRNRKSHYSFVGSCLVSTVFLSRVLAFCDRAGHGPGPCFFCADEDPYRWASGTWIPRRFFRLNGKLARFRFLVLLWCCGWSTRQQTTGSPGRCTNIGTEPSRLYGPLRAWPLLQRGRDPPPASAGADSRLVRFGRRLGIPRPFCGFSFRIDSRLGRLSFVSRSAAEVVPPAPVDVFVNHPPAATYVAPCPVVGSMAPALAASFSPLAPLVDDIAPAPAMEVTPNAAEIPEFIVEQMIQQ